MRKAIPVTLASATAAAALGLAACGGSSPQSGGHGSGSAPLKASCHVGVPAGAQHPRAGARQRPDQHVRALPAGRLHAGQQVPARTVTAVVVTLTPQVLPSYYSATPYLNGVALGWGASPTATPGVTSYHYQLYTRTGTLVADGRTTATSVRIGGLPSGTAYSWRLAVSQDPNHLASPWSSWRYVSTISTYAQRVAQIRSAAWGWAKTQQGKPYISGGTGPYGYDCSGLVYAGYRRAGFAMPRTTYQMLASPHLVRISMASALPGDLAFYTSSHVEYYVNSHTTFGALRPGTSIGYHQTYPSWHPTLFYRIRP